jgi:DNA-binding HxlR family transcriptional regulator
MKLSKAPIISQQKLLRTLHHKYPITAYEITKASKVTKLWVYHSLKELKEQGFVKEFNDNYPAEFSLTTKGCQLRDVIDLYFDMLSNNIKHRKDIKDKLESLVRYCGFEGLKEDKK